MLSVLVLDFFVNYFSRKLSQRVLSKNVFIDDHKELMFNSQ